MSASEGARSALRALVEVAYGLIGWLLIAPLAALVPKRRDWVAVIGRGDGKFLDNTKYFFMDAAVDARLALRIVHVTERPDVLHVIRDAGFESLQYPSLRAAWFLARCGNAVVDSIEWCERWRSFLLVRARLIQLWHGVGFKRIEFDKWRNEAKGRRHVSARWLLWPRLARRYLRGRVPRYDAVVTTSAFYRDNVFSVAFRHRHVLTTGYPRNAFGKNQPHNPLTWTNVDPQAVAKLAKWRCDQRKLILVAPTFRDTRATPLGLDDGRLAQLDAFCSENGYEFLFKLHPYEHGVNRIHGEHLHVLGSESDVYPLLPDIAAVVTDYSSIYMDYLLLDRPVYFLTPDLQDYLNRDRDIQFDFERMTPGPKLSNWDALLDAIVEPEDAGRARQRADLKTLAFGNEDQAMSTQRLLDFMQRQNWVRVPSIRTNSSSVSRVSKRSLP
jgi:CDP-glycerol glycerophosphotransferase (TagB/SpsB family)